MKKYKHKHTQAVVLHESVGNYTVVDWGIFKPINNSIKLNFDFNSNDWEEIKEDNKKQENMKKYKLIKEYPCSPLKETVVSKDKLGQYVAENPLLIFQKVDIEQYPEFWEEVKEEPNYLITAFRDIMNYIYRIDESGYYKTKETSGFTYGATFKWLIDNKVEIYSVKNSKGEEFTIGDKVLSVKDKLTISKFEICGDGIIVRFKETDEHDGLELISKIKDPLYTTTDGKEIFEGDMTWLYLLDKDLQKPRESAICCFTKKDKEVADRYLTFTSRESREKYIKEHTRKPIFVSADGKEMYEGDTVWHLQNESDFQLSCSTVRERNVYGKIRFSTEEKAKEYIDNNKPKFSISDIENLLTSYVDSELTELTIGTKNAIIYTLKALGK